MACGDTRHGFHSTVSGRRPSGYFLFDDLEFPKLFADLPRVLGGFTWPISDTSWPGRCIAERRAAAKSKRKRQSLHLLPGAPSISLRPGIDQKRAALWRFPANAELFHARLRRP